MNEYLVITWADSGPVKDGLAEAARDRGSQLLAAGPVHGTGELDSRPAPAGAVIARFSTEAAARSWFDANLGKLDGTTLLAAGATAPVWWPPEKEPERSDVITARGIVGRPSPADPRDPDVVRAKALARAQLTGPSPSNRACW